MEGAGSTILNLVEIENILPQSVSLSDVLAHQCNDKNSAISHLVQDAVTASLKEKLTKRRLATTFESPYALSDDQLRALSRMYPEYNFSIKGGASFHTHAVAATSRIIERLIHCEVLGFSGQTAVPTGYSTFLSDCGGNYTAWSSSSPKSVHCCEPPITHYDVGRYAKRHYNSTYVTPLNEPNTVINLNSVVNSGEQRCRKLFQNCSVTSVAVVAIHSTYDIGVREFCEGMYKKRARRASISFLFDPAIMTCNEGRLGSLSCSWKIYLSKRERLIEFYFDNDYSTTYKHKLSTYLAWVQTNTITVNETTYIFEITANREGVLFMVVSATEERPMRSMRVSRNLWSIVSEAQTTIKHYKWNYNVSSDSHIDILLKPFFFTVPTWLFNVTMSHAQTLEDSKFLPKNVHSYALSYNTKMITDAKNIYYGCTLSPELLSFMATAIYLILFRARWEQGKILQVLLANERQIRAEQDDGIFKKLLTMLQQRCKKAVDMTFDKFYLFLAGEKPEAVGYFPVSQVYTVDELVDDKYDEINLRYDDDADLDMKNSTVLERAIKGEYKQPVSIIFEKTEDGNFTVSRNEIKNDSPNNLLYMLKNNPFLTGQHIVEPYMGKVLEGNEKIYSMSPTLLSVDNFMQSVIKKIYGQDVTDPVRFIASKPLFTRLTTETKNAILEGKDSSNGDRFEFLVASVLSFVLKCSIHYLYNEKKFMFGEYSTSKPLVYMFIDSGASVFFSEVIEERGSRKRIYGDLSTTDEPDELATGVDYSVGACSSSRINWDYILVTMGLLDGRKNNYRLPKWSVEGMMVPKGFRKLNSIYDFDPTEHNFLYVDKINIEKVFSYTSSALLNVNFLMLLSEFKKCQSVFPYKIRAYGYLQFVVIRISSSVKSVTVSDFSKVPDYAYYYAQSTYDHEQLNEDVRLYLPMVNSYMLDKFRVEVRTTIANVRECGTICDILYADEGTIPMSLMESLASKFKLIGKKFPPVTRDISSWVESQEHRPRSLAIYAPTLRKTKNTPIITLRSIVSRCSDLGLTTCVIFVPDKDSVRSMCRSLKTFGTVSVFPRIPLQLVGGASSIDVLTNLITTSDLKHIHFELTDYEFMKQCCMVRYEGVNTYSPYIVRTFDSIQRDVDYRYLAKSLTYNSVALSVQTLITDSTPESVSVRLLPHMRNGNQLIYLTKNVMDDGLLKLVPYFDHVDIYSTNEGAIFHMTGYFKFSRTCTYTYHSTSSLAASVEKQNDEPGPITLDPSHPDLQREKKISLSLDNNVILAELKSAGGCEVVKETDELTNESFLVVTKVKCNHRHSTLDMYYKNIIASEKLKLSDALARLVEILKAPSNKRLECEHWELLEKINNELEIFPDEQFKSSVNSNSSASLRRYLLADTIPVVHNNGTYYMEHVKEYTILKSIDDLDRSEMPPVKNEDSLAVYITNRKNGEKKYRPEFEPYDPRDVGVTYRNSIRETISMWSSSESIMLPIHDELYKSLVPFDGYPFNTIRVALQRENVGFLSVITGSYVVVPKHGTQSHCFAYDGRKFVKLPRNKKGELGNLTELKEDMEGREYLMVTDMTELMVESVLAASVKNVQWMRLRSDLELTLVLGVPGCGKTTLILNSIKSGDSVVAATREGAISIGNRVAPHLKIPKVRTVHSYIINKIPGECETLYVDEVAMRHFGEVMISVYMSGCKSVIMVGDKKQIPFFTILTEVFMLYADATLAVPTIRELLVSHRCPQDVISAITRFYSGDVKTTSKVVRSLELRKYNTFDLGSLVAAHPDSKVLCYKQSEKLELNLKNFNVSTIGEFQGQEVGTIILVRLSVRDNDEIYNREDQNIVGITRHRNKFIYYSPRIEDLMTRLISLASVDTSLDRFVDRIKEGRESSLDTPQDYMKVPGDGRCLYRAIMIGCGATNWETNNYDDVMNVDIIRYAIYVYARYTKDSELFSLYDFSSFEYDSITMDPKTWLNLDLAALFSDMFGYDLVVSYPEKYVSSVSRGKSCTIRLRDVTGETAHAEPLPRAFDENVLFEFVKAATSTFRDPTISEILRSGQKVADSTPYNIHYSDTDKVYVTRATLKLMELLTLIKGLDATRNLKVCDIGAAPGGWESLLSALLPKSTVVSCSLSNGLNYKCQPNKNVIRMVIDPMVPSSMESGMYDYIFCDAATEQSWLTNAEAEYYSKWAKSHLVKNGVFVVKIANVFKTNEIRSILGGSFESCMWIKPTASRQHNTEVYLICQGYGSTIGQLISRPVNVMEQVLTSIGLVSKAYYNMTKGNNEYSWKSGTPRTYEEFTEALAGEDLRSLLIGGFFSKNDYTQYLQHSRKFDIPEVITKPYVVTSIVPPEVGSYSELTETCEILMTSSGGQNVSATKLYRSEDILIMTTIDDNTVRNTVSGGWTVLQDYYDRMMPGCSTHSRENDQMMAEMSKTDFSHKNVVINAGHSSVKSEIPTLRSILRTSMPQNRYQSQKDTLIALEKRNLHVPELSGIVDEDELARKIVQKLVDVIFIPEATVIMDRWKVDTVKPNPVDFSEWLKTQPNDLVKQITDSTAVQNKNLTAYTLMNKKQVKPDLTVNGPYVYSAVQTICYQEKELNAIFCPMFRLLKNRFMKLMKSKFVMYTDMSPEDFACMLSTRFPHVDIGPNVHKLEVDMAKYDKSQQRLHLKMELELYRRLGLDDRFRKLWFKGHAFTSLTDYHNKVKAFVIYQRKSGDASTYFGNTAILIMMLNWMYDISTCDLALFSGDDSVLIGGRIKEDLADDFAILFNMETKFFRYEYIYFCSKFLLKVGGRFQFVPDLIKMLTKMGRSDLRNYDHVEEYRRSLCDLTKVYKSTIIDNALTSAMSERYNVQLPVTYVLSSLLSILEDVEEFASGYSKRNEEDVLNNDPSLPSLE